MAEKKKQTKNVAQNTKHVDVEPYLRDITKVFAVIYLAVFPLLIGSGGYTNITKFKFVTFVVITAIFILTLLFVPPILRAKVKEKRTDKDLLLSLKKNAKKIGLPGLFLGLFVLWNTISALASPYGSQTFIGMSRYEGWLSMFLYAAVAVGFALYGEFDEIYVYAMAISSTIFGAIAFTQQMGSTILYPEGYEYYGSRFLATFGHEDCYAEITSIFIPMLLCGYVLLEKKEDRKFDFRLLTLLPMFLLTFNFLYSDVDCAKIGFIASMIIVPFLVDTKTHLSRFLQGFAPIAVGFGLFFAVLIGAEGKNVFVFGKKSLLCFIIAIVMFAAGCILEKKAVEFKVNPKKIHIIFYVLIAVAIVFALFFVYAYSGDNRLIVEFSELLHGKLSESAGNGRGLIWSGAYKALLKRPILGHGPGAFLAAYEEYNPWISSGSGVAVDFAHNDILQIAVCTGIVGALLYLVFLVSLLVRSIKSVEKNIAVKVICAVGIVGYFASVFFVFSIAIVTPIFWALIGLLLAETTKDDAVA